MKKKVKAISVKAYGFMDTDTQKILPPDVCPLHSTRREAFYEKKKYDVYYSNTKIIPVLITHYLPKKKPNHDTNK